MTAALKSEGPWLKRRDPDDDEVRIAVRCNVCRRWLTDPESVAYGAGARCRGERE